MTKHWMPAAAFAAALLGVSAAQACEVPNPLRPELAAMTPVVVRGEVTAIEATADGGAVLTIAVTDTLKGTEAETWTVAWSGWSVIVPPADLAAFEATYGTDVVLGLTPDVPGIEVDDAPTALDAGAGSLAQENCAVPFLDSYAALEPMLRERGLL
jgi:hypothetical protein